MGNISGTRDKPTKTESAQCRFKYKLNLGRDKVQVERHWDRAVLARLI